MSELPRELFQRLPSIRVIDRGERTTVLGRDGSAREFEGESAYLVRELLVALTSPRSMEEVLAHFEAVAGGVAEARETIEQALQHLRDAGAVVVTRADAPSPTILVQHGRLVLGVSGAIAAAHTPALVERFLRRGFEVRVAMTSAARHFVQLEALRALTHHRVFRSHWASTPDAPAPHIELAEWAEVVLLAPCTATTVARLARGDCSDVVSATALSTSAPVVVAPSMNVVMRRAPAIARNLEQLVEDGFHVLHPALGVEVAEAPAERRPILGSWPALDDIVASTEYVWTRARQRADAALPARSSQATWDAAYEKTPTGELPFHSEALDDDIRSVLEGVKRPATLWDVGTGLGTVALEAARIGFAVTGTDFSPRAIAVAARHASNGTRFLVDDIRRSTVEGTFDVVVDRGCLHTLDTGGARAYADAVRRHTRAGSLLVLKTHREDEPQDWHTVRYRLTDLHALFSPPFELVRWTETTLPGNRKPPARAWLSVWKRT